MPRKTKKADHDEPATKGFVRDAIDDLASAVKVGFDQAATRNDLATLDGKVTTLDGKVTTLDGKVTTLDGKVTTLDSKFTKLDEKVNRLEHGQKAMLGILDENNQLLKEIRRLPARVARLERSVFR